MDSFLIHVWESGGHIRLAELLKNDEPEESHECYQKAKKIVDSDPKLVIRRRQIKELGEKLGFRF